jgi:hypothetical protein
MSNNTKERLLNDLEVLRQRLAEIEAYGNDEPQVATTENAPVEVEEVLIPTLEVDNVPLLGDAIPANRDEAIDAHRKAMAQLDAELKEIYKSEQLPQHSGNDMLASMLQNASSLTQVSSNNESENNFSKSDPSDNNRSKHDSAPSIAAPLNGPEKTLSQTNSDKVLQPSSELKDRSSVRLDPQPNPSKPNQTIAASRQNATGAPLSVTPKGASSDENPFLPQHLRDRLNKSKSSLMEEIARSSESLDASTALLRNFGGVGNDGVIKSTALATSDSQSDLHTALIDSLVARYLPLIEADLRQRLMTSLQHQQVAAAAKLRHQPVDAEKPSNRLDANVTKS